LVAPDLVGEAEGAAGLVVVETQRRQPAAEQDVWGRELGQGRPARLALLDAVDLGDPAAKMHQVSKGHAEPLAGQFFEADQGFLLVLARSE
jgi:hypothetical protein